MGSGVVEAYSLWGRKLKNGQMKRYGKARGEELTGSRFCIEVICIRRPLAGVGLEESPAHQLPASSPFA
jgi:hypothetical protein